jgi:hypothetical protein
MAYRGALPFPETQNRAKNAEKLTQNSQKLVKMPVKMRER